jgi:FMN phosphatase YigB (HAD superfamily)
MFVEAFHLSRYQLSAGKLEYSPSPGLPAVLGRLREQGVYLVMQTNSSEDSGIPTLQFLGLDGLFDEYIYQAEKPRGMEGLFRRLERDRNIDAGQILSVGDHIVNDVDAAERLGGQALLVSPFRGLRSNGTVHRVHTVDELVARLERL